MLKRVLNNRPAVFAAFFLICGIAVSYYTNLPSSVSAWACGICAAAFLLMLLRQNRRAFFALYAAIFFAGALLFSIQFTNDLRGIETGDECVVTGQVKDRQLGPDTRYTLGNVILEHGGRRIELDKDVYLYGKEALDFGDIVRYEDKVTVPSAPRNPGAFDQRMYAAANNVAFTSFGYEVELVGHEDLWYVFPLRIREAVADKIDRYYSDDTAPLANAMFLGVKTQIPDELREEFSTTGISHVLAISGLHISIVAALFQWLLRKLRVRRNVRFPVLIAALLAYMLITGFAASVVRAVIMTVFLLLVRWRMEKRDTLTALGIAALAYLPFSTPQLFMPGFLMSYGAVLGLLCLTPAINRLFDKIKFQNKISFMLAASCAASLTVFPLTAYFFGGIAAAAPLTNFYAVPLTTVAVIFTALFTLVSWIPPAAAIVAFVPQVALELLHYGNQFVAQTGFGYLETPGFPFWVGIPVIAVIFICSDYFLIKRKWKTVTAAVAAGLLVLTLGVNAGQQGRIALEINILDVGAGDAIHLKTKEGDWLVDNGGNMQRSQLEDYSEANRIVYDAAIVTNDRTNDLQDLIADGRVKELRVPENYIPKEQDENIQMNYYGIYDKMDLGGGAYVQAVSDDGKHLSLAVYANGTCVALLAQNGAEDLPEIGAAVVKPCKGGEDGSVSEKMLEGTQAMVVSMRAKNKDGQPGAETMALADRSGVPVYDTASCGCVRIFVGTDGSVKIETTK